MGFWRQLLNGDALVAEPLAHASAPLVATPVQGYPTTLPADVAAAFGIVQGGESVTRAEAMSIPAFRRGRNIIAGVLGTAPLGSRRVGTTEPVARKLLTQPDPNTTRQHVLTYTVEDLLLYGVAWWYVQARDREGYPTSIERATRERVMVDKARAEVRVDGLLVRDEDVIRFDGPDDGILNGDGARTLRTCLLLEQAVRRYARLDVPLGVLRQAEGSPTLTQEQVDNLLDEWEYHRRTRTTAFLSPSVQYEPMAFDAQKVQLAEARAYQNAEVARLLNLPGRYVGASDGDSMTYSNSESARRDLVDLSLAPYVSALQERLSLGDVTPAGQEVRLDLSSFLRGDTGTALAWAEKAVALGAMTGTEVRTDLLQKPALPDTPPAPAPEVTPDA